MAHNSPKVLGKAAGAISQQSAALVLLAESHIGSSIPFSACHVHQPTTVWAERGESQGGEEQPYTLRGKVALPSTAQDSEERKARTVLVHWASAQRGNKLWPV